MKVQGGDPLPSQEARQHPPSVPPAAQAPQDALSAFVCGLVPRPIPAALDLRYASFAVVWRRRRGLSAV